MNRGNRGGRPGFMPNRGRGGPPMFNRGGPGGPRGGGFRPRGPGGPQRFGMPFANRGSANRPSTHAVPPPGHQQWNAMGWNNGGNGPGGAPNFQNDWDGGGGPQENMNQGPGPLPLHLLSPDNVKEWLTRQHPGCITDIMMHAKFLLNKMGFGEEGPEAGGEGAGEFAADEVSNASWYEPINPHLNQHNMGPPSKRGKKHTGLGYQKPVPASQQQWTPEGWVVKDNSHKVTSMMKPLPKVQVVPPMSTTYPEASMDNDKLKMLENNVSMMTAELTKICKRFSVKTENLTKDPEQDLSQYPEAAQEKLKIALTCVGNAQTTLDDFLDFLKTEKYKEWNDQQEDKYKDQVKQMIGDTPEGVPHKRPASAVVNDEEGDDDEEGDEEDE